MKLHATIAGCRTEIQIQDAQRSVSADLDGRHYEVEVHESAGTYLLTHHGRVFDCRLESPPESGKTIDVVVGTTHYRVSIIDPKRLRGTAGTGLHADEAARIIAPMPGKVVRVLVKVGDPVEAGAGIVVVEAMKMQNEMKSPKAGTVIAIEVEVGATVNAGDVLAVIE